MHVQVSEILQQFLKFVDDLLFVLLISYEHDQLHGDQLLTN